MIPALLEMLVSDCEYVATCFHDLIYNFYFYFHVQVQFIRSLWYLLPRFVRVVRIIRPSTLLGRIASRNQSTHQRLSIWVYECSVQCSKFFPALFRTLARTLVLPFDRIHISICSNCSTLL